MKPSICLLPFALSSLVAAWVKVGGQDVFGGQEVIGGSTLAVPGANPLEFCDSDISKYLLTVEHVNLIPNPPVAGETLSIDAAGNFSVVVEKGAYVDLVVKFQKFIQILKRTEDLCAQMENVDEECPLEGKIQVIKDVDLPRQIPPGEYTVTADVYTKDKQRLTCIKATVRF